MSATLDQDFPPIPAEPNASLYEITLIKIGLTILREPFPAHQISTFPKNAGSKAGLSYVGHAALTDRLLDADPFWTWEPMSVDARGLPALDDDGGMWIRLTVCGVTRLGYGDAQGKTGGNAMKERIGDALRNAAMRFGAALDLWHKGELHIDSEVTPPPRLEADAFAELLDGINAATDELSLKKAFSAAFRTADTAKDKEALKLIVRAKDAKKADLAKVAQ